jgi:hypothetical protein
VKNSGRPPLAFPEFFSVELCQPNLLPLQKSKSGKTLLRMGDKSLPQFICPLKTPNLDKIRTAVKIFSVYWFSCGGFRQKGKKIPIDRQQMSDLLEWLAIRWRYFG